MIERMAARWRTASEVASEPTVPQLTHQRPWVARLFGVVGPFTLPIAGVPASALLAIPALGLKRPPVLPVLTKTIAWWSVVGALLCVISAAVNGVSLSPIPGQLATLGLLLFAYRATIVSVGNAAILVGWLAASSTLFILAFGSGITRTSFEMLWKFGIAYTVTIFTLYALARFAPAWISVVALVGLGTMGTFLNFRSFGLVCIVAAALSMAKLVGRRRPFLTALVSIVLVWVISFALPRALEQGVFGVDAQYKTLSQSDDGPVLLGGRTEPPLSIAAIVARPLLGWGNVQAIDSETVNSGIGIAQWMGMFDVATYTRYWIRSDGFISLHSMLFVPWVEGGPVAAVAPLLLIALFSWAAFVARGRWGVLVTLVSVQNVWDILFSPWTGERVVSVAAAAILAGFAIVDARTAAASPASHLTRVRTTPSR